MTAGTPRDLRDAFFDTLREEAQRHPDLVLLTADMGARSLSALREAFPARVVNVGVAEQNMINVATGLALSGKKVITYSIASFALQRCYEQIKVNIADQALPVTVVGIGPGVAYASDGHSHHAVQDVANALALPNFAVLSPADPEGVAEVARRAAIATGPAYVRLAKGSFPPLPGKIFRPGIRVLSRGGPVLLLATGVIAQQLPALVSRLSAHGVEASAAVIEQLRPLAPDDLRALLEPYQAVVTVEEHLLHGGLGSLVASTLMDADLSPGLLRLGLPESVVTMLHGSRDWMLSNNGLDVASLEARVLDFLQRRSASDIALTGASAGQAGGTPLTLGVPEFISLLGLPEDAFPPELRRFIVETDFSYRILTGASRERMLLDVLRVVDGGSLTVSGPHRRGVWETGWQENLTQFDATEHDPSVLVPKFVRRGVVKRLDGQFIVPSNPDFESVFVRVQREALCRHYFRSARRVFEFGCGTGLNLLAMAGIDASKRYVGLDWADSAVSIVTRLGETQALPIEGRWFDMFAPDPSIDLSPNDAVFTTGALEQLGDRFEAFLQFLLDKQPMVCVHCETFDELYDRDTLADYAAVRYGLARRYLRGFLARLRALEQEGRVEVLQVRRTFGGQFHEGYSFAAWRPVRTR